MHKILDTDEIGIWKLLNNDSSDTMSVEQMITK